MTDRTVSVLEDIKTPEEAAFLAKSAMQMADAYWMRYAELTGAIPKPKRSYGKLLQDTVGAAGRKQPPRKPRPVSPSALGPRIHALEEAAKRVRR